MSLETSAGSAWAAYGGAAGDRDASARRQVRSCEEAVAAAVEHGGALEVAEAQWRLGRALSYAAYLDKGERFSRAHTAMQAAVTLGEQDGKAKDRARWWRGLGAAYKNLADDNKRENLEESLSCHLRALVIARQASERREQAAALAGLGTTLTYRIAGNVEQNARLGGLLLQRAARMIDHEPAQAAVWLTSAGIAWDRHNDMEFAGPRATRCYDEASALLDVEKFPAHARRLGRSAGYSAMRLGQWERAAAMYEVAQVGLDRLVSQSESQASQRAESAEFADTATRHLYALIRAGWLVEAVMTAEQYRRRIEPGREAGEEPSSEQPKELFCYLAGSEFGSAALLCRFDGTAPTDIVAVPLELRTDWLKLELKWPQPVSGHGGLVAAMSLDENSLAGREHSSELVAKVADEVCRPLLKATESTAAPLIVIGFGVMAELPLHAAVARASSGSASGGRRGLSWAPSARVARSISRLAARQEKRELLTVAVPDSASGSAALAAQESRAIARLFPGPVTSLVGAEASVARVREHLSSASHVHFAGHGYFAYRDPESSYLECSDGHLSVTDLDATAAFTQTRLFVASACSVGSVDTILWPDDVTGLPTWLLRRGCSLIAATRPVFDFAAALSAVRLFELLRADPQAHPGALLVDVQRWLRTTEHQSVKQWAATHDLDIDERAFGSNGGSTWAAQADVWGSSAYFGRG